MFKSSRDTIIYVIIAVGVAGLIVFAVLRGPQQANQAQVTKQVMYLVLTLAAAFGYTIQEWKRAWPHPRFWLVISLLFAGFVPLQWKLIAYFGARVLVFIVLTLVELFVLLTILDQFLPETWRGRN